MFLKDLENGIAQIITSVRVIVVVLVGSAALYL